MIEDGAEIKIFSIHCDGLVYTVVAQRPDQIYKFDELLDCEISVLYGRREELSLDDRSAVESAAFQLHYHQRTFGEPPRLDEDLFGILIARAHHWLARDLLDLEAEEDTRRESEIEWSAGEHAEPDAMDLSYESDDSMLHTGQSPREPSSGSESPAFSFSEESSMDSTIYVTPNHPSEPDLLMQHHRVTCSSDPPVELVVLSSDDEY